MANYKPMKTLTIGVNQYEVVDAYARTEIESLKSNGSGSGGSIVSGNYLPLSGGTLSDNLWISKTAMPSVVLKTNYGESKIYRNASDDVEDGLHIVDYGKDLTYKNYSILKLSETSSIENAITFNKIVNGVANAYPLYGKHNRPFGTYTGDGSINLRQIEVGGNGNAVIIFSNTVKFAIVTSFGAFYVTSNGVTQSQSTSQIVYGGTSFNMGGSNHIFNESGVEYKYIVI